MAQHQCSLQHSLQQAGGRQDPGKGSSQDSWSKLPKGIFNATWCSWDMKTKKKEDRGEAIIIYICLLKQTLYMLQSCLLRSSQTSLADGKERIKYLRRFFPLLAYVTFASNCGLQKLSGIHMSHTFKKWFLQWFLLFWVGVKQKSPCHVFTSLEIIIESVRLVTNSCPSWGKIKKLDLRKFFFSERIGFTAGLEGGGACVLFFIK